MTSTSCANCSSRVDPDAVFCSVCGEPVAATSSKTCVRCGKPLNATHSNFCKYCGFEWSAISSSIPILQARVADAHDKAKERPVVEEREGSSRNERQNSKRAEIIIAVIGLVGILATAFLSNLDKLFPKRNVVQAEYSGYRPTGNFETEFRYYCEVSGLRLSFESLQRQLIQEAKNKLIADNPAEAQKINKTFDLALEEAPKFEDMIRELMPVYQKHFALNEIQELNKFYSTDLMQGLVKRMPLLIQDSSPIETKTILDYLERYYRRLNEVNAPSD